MNILYQQKRVHSFSDIIFILKNWFKTIGENSRDRVSSVKPQTLLNNGEKSYMTFTIKIHVCSMYIRCRFLFMRDKSKAIISLTYEVKIGIITFIYLFLLWSVSEVKIYSAWIINNRKIFISVEIGVKKLLVDYISY